VCYPAGLASAADWGRKYRLEAGMKTSTIDAREMSQSTAPGAGALPARSRDR